MICNKCLVNKEATEENYRFRTDAQCLRKTCRECESAKRKERLYRDEYGTGIEAYYRHLKRERLRARRARKKKPEINRKATARWRAKNKDKSNALARACRVRRGAAYMKEWRARNRDWYNAYMRDWRRWNKLSVSDANELIDLVTSALPSGLPAETKDEVMQEMMVQVLSKKVKVSKITQEIKPLITKFYRDYANRALLSLDAPIIGFEDLTIGETLEG